MSLRIEDSFHTTYLQKNDIHCELNTLRYRITLKVRRIRPQLYFQTLYRFMYNPFRRCY